MSIVSLIIVLAIVGFVLWLVTTYIPMDPRFKQVIVIVVLVFLVIWLLQALGLLGSIGDLRLE